MRNKTVKLVSAKEFEDMFSYGTSIEEDTSLFIDREPDITLTYLIRTTYNRKTKKFLKYLRNKLGVVETRKYLSRRMKRLGLYR